jgi:hypothetical protein
MCSETACGRICPFASFLDPCSFARSLSPSLPLSPVVANPSYTTRPPPSSTLSLGAFSLCGAQLNFGGRDGGGGVSMTGPDQPV